MVREVPYTTFNTSRIPRTHTQTKMFVEKIENQEIVVKRIIAMVYCGIVDGSGQFHIRKPPPLFQIWGKQGGGAFLCVFFFDRFGPFLVKVVPFT